jgi:hypothetical protein
MSATSAFAGPGPGRYTSRFLTLAAFSSMNRRRSSTLLDALAHQQAEDAVRLPGVDVGLFQVVRILGDDHPAQRADLGVHRRLPKLTRVHLAQPLEALDAQPLAAQIANRGCDLEQVVQLHPLAVLGPQHEPRRRRPARGA